MTHRRLCGAIGVGLLLTASAAAALVGVSGLRRAPATATQVGLLGITGVLDLLAAFENPLTERIDWYRLGGVANVALGMALPVGVLGWSGHGTGGTMLLAVTALGGLALAAIGVDLVVFAGANVYERPLDWRGSE